MSLADMMDIILESDEEEEKKEEKEEEKEEEIEEKEEEKEECNDEAKTKDVTTEGLGGAASNNDENYDQTGLSPNARGIYDVKSKTLVSIPTALQQKTAPESVCKIPSMSADKAEDNDKRAMYVDNAPAFYEEHGECTVSSVKNQGHYNPNVFMDNELRLHPDLKNPPPVLVPEFSKISTMVSSALFQYVLEDDIFSNGYPQGEKMASSEFKVSTEDPELSDLACAVCHNWPMIRHGTHCTKAVCNSCMKKWNTSSLNRNCMACSQPPDGVALYTYSPETQKHWEKSRIECGLCSCEIELGSKHQHIQMDCPAASERHRWHAWVQRVVFETEKKELKNKLDLAELRNSKAGATDSSLCDVSSCDLADVNKRIYDSQQTSRGTLLSLRVITNSISGVCGYGERFKNAKSAYAPTSTTTFDSRLANHVPPSKLKQTLEDRLKKEQMNITNLESARLKISANMFSEPLKGKKDTSKKKGAGKNRKHADDECEESDGDDDYFEDFESIVNEFREKRNPLGRARKRQGHASSRQIFPVVEDLDNSDEGTYVGGIR